MKKENCIITGRTDDSSYGDLDAQAQEAQIPQRDTKGSLTCSSR